jgi:hypothetical protein
MADKRFTLNMDENYDAKLGQLSEAYGLSKGEILKRGLVLLDYVAKAKEEGYHLGVVKTPEKLDREVIILP